MALINYSATSLTGGGSGALDSIDGTSLTDLDSCIVFTLATVYVYSLDDDSAASESSPDVISPDANAGNKRWILVAALGTAGTSLTFTNTGLHVLDSNATHDLILKPGSNLTADKTLTLTTGDADRTITLSGNPTLADWFDQAVKAASSPTFANVTIAAATGITFANTGLHVLDSNASHDLIIKPGSNLTADKTLTITTGNADRTITLSGNPTLSDWFDQAVKAASSPTFAALTLTADLAVAHGGTGASTATLARASLSAAVLGANDDITSMTGLSDAGIPLAKVATAAAITATEVVAASTDTLSALECSGTFINNYGQGSANTQTLPAAAEGLNGIVHISAAGVGAFHLKAGTGDKIYLDGTALSDGDKASIATPAVGNSMTFWSFQTGASAYDWIVSSGAGTTVTDGGA